MPELYVIIVACTIQATPLSAVSNACEEFYEKLNYELQEVLTPYSCMMRSPIYVSQFMTKHPGMAPRKWTCKLLKDSDKKIKL